VENEYTAEKLVYSAIFVPKIFMICVNLTKFWQKISLHSFFWDTVYTISRCSVIITVNSIRGYCHQSCLLVSLFVSKSKSPIFMKFGLMFKYCVNKPQKFFFHHILFHYDLDPLTFWSVAQPGFSFGWGTTRLSFAFFLPSPSFSSFTSSLLPFMYPLALPWPCHFPVPSLPSSKFS